MSDDKKRYPIGESEPERRRQAERAASGPQAAAQTPEPARRGTEAPAEAGPEAAAMRMPAGAPAPEPPVAAGEEGAASALAELASAQAVLAPERLDADAAPAELAPAEAAPAPPAGGPLWLRFRLNGQRRELRVDPSRRLLAVIREDLGLTGTKRSCEIGRCGACMVLVDGEPMNSCLLSAYQCQEADIVTIEGLRDERAERVKSAFLEEGGFQCGYCTPGMVVSVTSMLAANPCPSRAETEEALAGNICRCTGYGSIFRAVCRASAGEPDANLI